MMSAISVEDLLRCSIEPRLMFMETMLEPLFCIDAKVLSELACPNL